MRVSRRDGLDQLNYLFGKRLADCVIALVRVLVVMVKGLAEATDGAIRVVLLGEAVNQATKVAENINDDDY